MRLHVIIKLGRNSFMRDNETIEELIQKLQKEKRALLKWILAKACMLKEAVALEAKYLYLFGKALDEEFEVAICIQKNKRMLDLYQKAYEKEEYPKSEEIESKVEEEFFHFHSKRQEMLENLDFAIFFMNLEAVPMDIKQEIDKQYKLLLQKLHPDLWWETSEKQQELYSLLQRAFDTNDIELIHHVKEQAKRIKIREEYLQNPKIVADWINVLSKKQEELQDQVEFIKHSFPLNQKKILDDPAKVKSVLLEIKQATEMNQVKNRVLEEELEKIQPAKTLQ